MSAQVIKLRSGDTVSVRTGVLRGAGPQGPMGPPGATGPQGSQGLQGEPGEVNDVRAQLRSSAAVATSYDQWYPLALDEVLRNEILTENAVGGGVDPYALKFTEVGCYLFVGLVTFEPPAGGATGARRVRVANQAGTTVAEASLEAAATGATVVPFVAYVDVDPTHTYTLQAQSQDAVGINVSTRYFSAARVGAGRQGDAGPMGPVGQTGPQGPKGDPGDATTGFQSFDGVIGGTDSTLDPGAATYETTADQQVTVPSGTTSPTVPFFLRSLVEWLEKRIVARFTDAADRDARRATRSPGEVYMLADTGELFFREYNDVENHLARVVVSSSPPPSGTGVAPPGVLWVQI